MAARQRTHQEIIDLLGRAVGQAQLAEGYHVAAGDPVRWRDRQRTRPRGTPRRCR